MADELVEDSIEAKAAGSVAVLPITQLTDVIPVATAKPIIEFAAWARHEAIPQLVLEIRSLRKARLDDARALTEIEERCSRLVSEIASLKGQR